MKCDNCSTDNPIGSRFCNDCGLALNKPCIACTEINRGSARFCGQCGAAFASLSGIGRRAAEGELKQVTVLFADLRGSTDLIQALDPEAAMGQLDPAVRLMVDAVEQFGGVVNKQQGDGIMALFGVPNACEDHAVRACLASRAVIDGVAGLDDPGIAIRVGLASGNVVVRATGSDATDFDAIGVTVHIAARLEQLTDPGTVQIAEQTARLARGFVQVKALPPVTVKGIAGPVETFRLLSATERPSWEVRATAHALNKFVGREAELLQMHAAMRRAGLGRGQALSVIGDAGQGKSRLVHEFLRTAPVGGWDVLQVSTTPQTSGAAFHLAAELLRAWTGVTPADGAAEMGSKLDRALAGPTGQPTLDVAPLRWLLDLPVHDPAWHTLDFATRRARVAAAMRQALLRETERHPTLLVVEDCQWADQPSIEVLSSIVEGMAATRMLVLATSRPDRRPSWTTLGYATELDLGPLDAASAEALLSELLGESDELASLRAQILQQADGTPLFLEEIARSLVESGVVLTQPARTMMMREAADVQIPASVRAILAARIDRLPPVRRRLLQLASVIGKDVPLRLLAAVSELPEPALEAELLELQKAEFLYEINFAFGREYTFKHVLTQTVAYESMLRRHRRSLHGDVLRAMEVAYANRIDEWTQRLVGHAMAGEVWPAASAYGLKAAERANRSCAWYDAIKFLENAIAAAAHLPETPEALEQAIEMRIQLRVALAALSDLPRLRSVLAEARTLEQRSGDPLHLARIDTSRCLNFTMVGELDEAILSGKSAHRTLHGLGEPGGVVSSGFALGQAHWFRGEFQQAAQVLRDGYHHARDGHALRNTGTTGTAAVLYLTCLMRTHVMTGDFEGAHAVNAQARRVANVLQRPFDLAELGQAEGFMHLVAGQAETAVAVLQEALSLARSSGSALLLPIIAAALGRALVVAGQVDEAERLLEEALLQTERHGYHAMRIWCGPALGLVKAHRSPDAGRAEHLASLARARAHGFRPVEAQTLRLLGDLSAQQGHADAAVFYSEARALARALDMKPEMDAAQAGLASVRQYIRRAS